MACWTIKKIADTETICFISKPSLYKKFSSSTHDHYQTRYDINSIIWPEQLLTQDIFRIISVPDALDVEFLAGGKAKLLEYRVEEASSIIDKPIMACKFPVNAIIGLIVRGHRVLIPNGNNVISSGDRLKIFTMKEDSENVKGLFS